MAEKLPNRPAGGREDDFNDLSDWTITDIATAPNTAPEDRKNAEAEIARREEAGIYNPDEAPQEVRSDLLSHGYGVENGRVLYPKPEYKSWLESDRSEPIPRGIVRESIKDRLRAERQEAAKAHTELLREYNRAAGEAAISAFEDTPTREKISHPSRFTSEKDKIARERRAEEKARGIEIDSRREMKESNKYDNNFLNLEKIATAEARANLPLAEEKTNIKELSMTERADRALDYAKLKIRKSSIDDLYTEGALDHIANGDFSFNPNFIQSGFSSYYGAEIERRAGATRDMVWDAIKYDGILPKVESAEQLEELESNAVRAAVEIGATRVRDGKTGREHVEFALPLQKLGNEKVDEIITRFGIKYSSLSDDVDDDKIESDKEATEAYELFESGFVNIVDAFKNDRESKEGFEELDWYFDHLLVGLPEKKIAERIIGTYEAAENNAFVDKLNQFIKWRDERKEKITEAIEEEKNNESINEAKEIVKFADENNEESSLEEETVFSGVGRGNERHPRGGHARRNPDDYGIRKERAFNEQMKTIEQIPGFKAGKPYVTLSKPFYMRNIYKEVEYEPGKRGKVLDRTLVMGAHFDREKGVYVSDTSGNEIDSQCIRRYKSAYFSINGVPISIKESVTNISGSMFIVFDEDALAPDQEVFHDSISGAINTIRSQGRKIIKKNHCQYVENGIKEYHGFGKMWQKSIREILEYVKDKAG